MNPLAVSALIDPRLRLAARVSFERHGWVVAEVDDAATATEECACRHPRVVLIEHSPHTQPHGLELCHRIRRISRTMPVVLVANPSSEEIAIEALRAGVTEYLKSPFRFDLLVKTLGGEREKQTVGAIVGNSTRLRELRAAIAAIADTDSIVLITGETGTGKELASRSIHQLSRRKRKPFTSLNCAALPESLIESELFGHERGSFTDARQAYPGKLKLTDGGTVVLDEIGDMSLTAQAKLLRVIESREIQRIGGPAPVSLDVRFIAATNRDLDAMRVEMRFRSDLFYRLNVARIHMPALREHMEDLPMLVEHQLADLIPRMSRCVDGISADALACLADYSWPGNVRELRNVLEAALIHLNSPTIGRNNLPEYVRRGDASGSHGSVEQRRLMDTLLQYNWNVSRTAESLHWSRMTVYRKMTRYGIKPL